MPRPNKPAVRLRTKTQRETTNRSSARYSREDIQSFSSAGSDERRSSRGPKRSDAPRDFNRRDSSDDRRGSGRSASAGAGRGTGRSFDRSSGRSSERSSERSSDRGADRRTERSSSRDFENRPARRGEGSSSRPPFSRSRRTDEGSDAGRDSRFEKREFSPRRDDARSSDSPRSAASERRSTSRPVRDILHKRADNKVFRQRRKGPFTRIDSDRDDERSQQRFEDRPADRGFERDNDRPSKRFDRPRSDSRPERGSRFEGSDSQRESSDSGSRDFASRTPRSQSSDSRRGSGSYERKRDSDSRSTSGSDRGSKRFSAEPRFEKSDSRRPARKFGERDSFDKTSKFRGSKSFDDRSDRVTESDASIERSAMEETPRRTARVRSVPGKEVEHTGDLRLNKFLADAGISSRRSADELILSGVVKVNGKIIRELGTKVHPADLVTVKGEPVSYIKHLTYLVLNKPKDYITTTADEKGRKTVMDLIPLKQRLYPVGRLDRNTTGTLLITNDGELATRLMHPSHGIEREYVVGLDKKFQPEHGREISKGVELEDGMSGPAILRVNPDDRSELHIILSEGKNREVRRLFEHFGYEVKRLHRIRYASIVVSGMSRGEYRHLSRDEVRSLRSAVGLE